MTGRELVWLASMAMSGAVLGIFFAQSLALFAYGVVWLVLVATTSPPGP